MSFPLLGHRKLTFGSWLLIAQCAFAEANVPATPSGSASSASEIIEGALVADYKGKLKALFPEADSYREIQFLPSENGGSSLMGLIHRLLGEQVQKTFEGVKTRRHIYVALTKDKPIGLAHASTTEVDGKIIDVVVFYDANGTIRNLDIEKAPSEVLSGLDKGGYLSQFNGKNSEDFEIVLGRKGRIKSRGPFLSQSKKPGSQPLRTYFDKILRSVRFNTAFMEVAYFIAQHPEENVAQ